MMSPSASGPVVARIKGVPVSVNWGLMAVSVAFVLLLATQAFPRFDPGASLAVRLTAASATVLLFLGSTLAHELGHATVARRSGIAVHGIALSLLGGYAKLDRQAESPRQEFTIAAAGPAVNLGLGLGLVGLLVAVRPLDPGPLPLAVGGWLAGVNLLLAATNLIPAAPLDGGRVLTAALWRRLGDAESARIISGRVGLIFGVLCAVAGSALFMSGWVEGLMVLMVGAFVFGGARAEIGTATVRRRLRRAMSGDVMVANPPTVSDSLTVEQLDRLVGTEKAGVAFPVTRWSDDPIGYIIPAAIDAATGPARSWTSVSDRMTPVADVARAWRTERLYEVLDRYEHSGDLLVVVHEPRTGRVIGTMTDAQVRPLLRRPDIWGRDRDDPVAGGDGRSERSGNISTG